MEFLQSYGIFIILGLLFSLMIWRSIRGRGAGCCDDHQHTPEKVIEEQRAGTGKHSSDCH